MGATVGQGGAIGPEGRAITRGDAAALVLGAVAAIASLPAWAAMARGLPWFGLGLFLRNAAGLWGAAVVLGAAALGRSIRSSRFPRPAEWLVLGGVAWGVAQLLPPSALEDFVQVVGRAARPFGDSELTARWATALVGGAMVGLGLVAARWGLGVVASPVLTAWLVFLLFLALWCPLSLFNDHAADWFAPGAGFGPGTGMVLYRGACQWFAATPTGVLVGLPVVACLGERLRGRPWSWLEWSAAATAALAGLLAVLAYRGELPIGTPGWFAERAVALAWLVAVALVDRALVARLGRRGPGGTSSAAPDLQRVSPIRRGPPTPRPGT